MTARVTSAAGGVLLALALAPIARAQAPSVPPTTGPAAASLAALDDRQKAAVEEALQDEYEGEAIYARVLREHGDVRPFSNVVRAERRHAAFLEDLLTSRGLSVPANRRASGEVPRYASVREACAAAVAFEARNVALYDRLLAAGGLPEDVRRAFEHNRTASLERHQPAFERCAGGAEGAGGPAARQGRGYGRRGCGHGCSHGGCAHGCAHHGCGHRGGPRGGGPGSD